MDTPAENGGVYAGAKSRYDDFVALHIIQTNYIHFNVKFQSLRVMGETKLDIRHRDCSWHGIDGSYISSRKSFAARVATMGPNRKSPNTHENIEH